MNTREKLLTEKLEQADIGEKAKVLNELARLLQNRDFEKSVSYADQAMEIARKASDMDNWWDSLINKSSAFYYRSEYHQAISILDECEPIIEKISSKRRRSQFPHLMGLCNYQLGNFQVALKYNLKALEYREFIGEPVEIASSLNNIGEIYRCLNEYSSAMEFHKRALDYWKDLDKKWMAASLNNIGNLHRNLDEIEPALKAFKEAEKIFSELEDKYYLASVLNNIGVCLRELKDFQTSLEYHEQALTLFEKIDDRLSLSGTRINIGCNLVSLGRFEEAEDVLKTSLKIAQEIESKHLQQEIYLAFYEMFEVKKSFKEALDYLKKHIDLKTQINSEETRRITAEMKEQYELEKKQREIQFANQKAEIYKLKNIELAKSNQALKLSKERLKELIAARDNFFSVVAHDLKNPLMLILCSAEMLQKDFEHLSPEDLKWCAGEIHSEALRLNSLLLDLQKWSQSISDHLIFNPKPENVHVIAANIVEFIYKMAEQKNICIMNRIPENTTISVDSNLLSTILRNLVSNSIKFTDPSGFIALDYDFDCNWKILTISDNGIGMSEMNLKKLFRMDEHYTTRGTAGETGTGMGLIICNEYMAKHKGKIEIQSQPGQGTQVQLLFPNPNSDS